MVAAAVITRPVAACPMRTEDNGHSVRIGQAATGRVITAAATIMILVFGSFLLAGQRVIAEFAIGLSSAVFLDAFVLRTVLVPAASQSQRRGRDSNPRTRLTPVTRFPVVPVQPLRHLSRRVTG